MTLPLPIFSPCMNDLGNSFWRFLRDLLGSPLLCAKMVFRLFPSTLALILRMMYSTRISNIPLYTSLGVIGFNLCGWVCLVLLFPALDSMMVVVLRLFAVKISCMVCLVFLERMLGRLLMVMLYSTSPFGSSKYVLNFPFPSSWRTLVLQWPGTCRK